MRRAVVLALCVLAGGAAPARAQQCLSADLPAAGATQPLRFGTVPLAAGSAGAVQGTSAGLLRQALGFA